MTIAHMIVLIAAPAMAAPIPVFTVFQLTHMGTTMGTTFRIVAV